MYVRRQREAARKCTPPAYPLVVAGNGTYHEDSCSLEHVRIAVWTGCDHKWEAFWFFPFLVFYSLILSQSPYVPVDFDLSDHSAHFSEIPDRQQP